MRSNGSLRKRVLELGITPEHSSTADLLRHAVQIESSLQYTTKDAMAHLRSSTKQTESLMAISRTQAAPAANTLPMAKQPFVRYGQMPRAFTPGKPYVKPSMAPNTVRQTTASAAQLGQPDKRYTPSTGGKSVATNIAKSDPKCQIMDKSHIQCYSCKQHGHYAQNCPYKDSHPVAAAAELSELAPELLPEDDIYNSDESLPLQYEAYPEGDQYDLEWDYDYNDVVQVHPNEDDMKYDETDVVMNPMVHFEPALESASGELHGYGGTVVPWNTVEALAASTEPMDVTHTVFRHH